MFPGRKPTKQEYENTDFALVRDLASEEVVWDPSDKRFTDQEAAMITAVS